MQDIALPSYALDSQLSQVQQFGEFTILPLFVFHKSGLFSKCTALSCMLMYLTRSTESTKVIEFTNSCQICFLPLMTKSLKVGLLSLNFCQYSEAISDKLFFRFDGSF